MLRRYLVPAVCCIGLSVGPAFADFQAGVDAYARGDMETVVKEWEAEAENGHAGAAWLLASLYAQGKGLPRIHARALKFYLIAAHGGHPGAQVAVGNYYRHGNDEAGVEQDYVLALRWFDAAALLADAEAQYILAVMHREGEGVERDRAESHRWLLLSAKKHYVPAFLKLADIYVRGDGVMADYVEGMKYLELARLRTTSDEAALVNDVRDRLINGISTQEREEGADRALLWLEGNPYNKAGQ